jgi:hypothetical protein
MRVLRQPDDVLNRAVQPHQIDWGLDAFGRASEAIFVDLRVVRVAHDQNGHAAASPYLQDRSDAVALRLAEVENDHIRIVLPYDVEKARFRIGSAGRTSVPVPWLGGTRDR